MRERGDEALARHGRALPGFPLCVYTTVRLDDDAVRARRETMEFLAAYYGGGVHQRGTMGLGPAEAVISALLGYAAAGVTDLCVRFVGDDQRAAARAIHGRGASRASDLKPGRISSRSLAQRCPVPARRASGRGSGRRISAGRRSPSAGCWSGPCRR